MLTMNVERDQRCHLAVAVDIHQQECPNPAALFEDESLRACPAHHVSEVVGVVRDLGGKARLIEAKKHLKVTACCVANQRFH